MTVYEELINDPKFLTKQTFFVIRYRRAVRNDETISEERRELLLESSRERMLFYLNLHRKLVKRFPTVSTRARLKQVNDQSAIIKQGLKEIDDLDIDESDKQMLRDRSNSWWTNKRLNG